MTLVELIGTIGVSAILLGVGTAVLAAMLRIDRSFAVSDAADIEWQRLAEHVRRDAHQALDLQITESGAAWSFTLPGDERVDYQETPGAVRRTRHSAEAENDAGRQQLLSLADAANVRVELVVLADRPFVRLTMTTSGDGAPRTTSYQVETELRRLAREAIDRQVGEGDQ
jgi:hypothetical protein